jgi:hypothetical protein
MEKIFLSNGCDFDEAYFKRYTDTEKLILEVFHKMITDALKRKVKSMRIKIEVEIEE